MAQSQVMHKEPIIGSHYLPYLETCMSGFGRYLWWAFCYYGIIFNRKMNTFNWNPLEKSDQENLTWSWLRAVEWGIWPAFLSGPVAPLFFLFFEWWKVIGVILILTIIWAFIRYKYINTTMASLGVYFVLLKWITCPLAAVIFAMQHNYILAVVSLLWPSLSAYFGFFVGGTKIGIIQKMIMKKFGYSENKNIM